MKRTAMVVAVLVGMQLIVSCRDINFTRAGYRKAVLSGLKTIPEAKQIEELLGDSDHFISYHGSRELGNEWYTEVHFGGRYSLTMQVPVRMGRDFDEVLEVIGDPTFLFLEANAIIEDGRGVTFDRSAERRFTAKEWAEIYEAKGDFSVIGITLKQDEPLEGFDKYVENVRKDHIKVKAED